MNELHEANRRHWEARSADWAKRANVEKLWRRCHREPGLVLDERELHWLGDLAGKRVAVLGSGDNLVAFALAGMGARVTSVDISENQLGTARQRAEALGLEIEFVRADVTELHDLATGSFDLIHTGGHIAIWVSDLRKFYREATRILKPRGLLIVSEYHPFRRLWKATKDRLELESDYFHRGPYSYETPGGKSHEFQWTVGDYVTAVMDAGCKLLAVEEFGSGSDGDWELAPVTGLPRVLLVVGRKWTVVFRPLTDAEEEDGYQIICDTVEWLRSKDIDLWRTPLPREVYAARHRRGENYGLFADGQLAAIVSLVRGAAKQWAEELPDPQIMWLSTLTTANAFRGRGLGRQIVNQAISYLAGRGENALYLDCKPGFLTEFYSSAGFKEIAQKHATITRGSACYRAEVVLMERG